MSEGVERPGDEGVETGGGFRGQVNGISLLRQVWGDDFFGGTRTVDRHVRRLRAKRHRARADDRHRARNVGYKPVRPALRTGHS